MPKYLEGKVALITGGSRGIGAAIAKRLAADGANVAITYTKGADAAASVVKEIERAGRKAIAIQADAADADAVKAAVEKTVTTLGRLDILVNNAGTAVPKRFEETTLEELDRLMDINVRGVFVATQAALKHMKSGGRIISIGSAVGERALTPGLVPYSATKGAVKMFTQGLSREVASRGITVNNVQPGPIDTDFDQSGCAGSGVHSAIDGKIRPGNVRGLRTGDKRHQCSDFINVPIAAKRCDGLLRRRPVACCRIQIRVDRTRVDVVDRDASVPDLSSQSLSEHLHGLPLWPRRELAQAPRHARRQRNRSR